MAKEKKVKKSVDEMTRQEREKYYERLVLKIRLGILLSGIVVLIICFATGVR